MVSTPVADTAAAAAAAASPLRAADSDAAPPPATGRPLLVAWPQVKAFVSMAQEALRAKAAAHEALRAEIERSREEHEETRRLESALSEDSAFLQDQVHALLAERGAALDRLASLEREIDFLRQERALLAEQLGEADGGAGGGGTGSTATHLARALGERLAMEAAARAAAEATASALADELAALRCGRGEAEAGVAPPPAAPLAPATVTQPAAQPAGVIGKKKAKRGRGGRGGAENVAP